MKQRGKETVLTISLKGMCTPKNMRAESTTLKYSAFRFFPPNQKQHNIWRLGNTIINNLHGCQFSNNKVITTQGERQNTENLRKKTKFK